MQAPTQEEIRIPVLYVLSRDVPEEKIPEVNRMFEMTPIAGVIVYDPKDYDLATQFHEHVVRTVSKATAFEIGLSFSEELKQPLLVVSDSTEILQAVYSNQEEEVISI
jgi:hypothetical protein